MKKTRSNTTMIEQTHNQVPQEPTTDSTVAASLRTLTLCLDQLLNPSSNSKDRLGLQVSTRPQQRRAREKPSNASFGSRTPPKLNEPTCTLNQHTPVISLRPYRTPYAYQKEIQDQISQLLKHDIITPSSSPYSSPVTLVRKRDNTMRLCIDFRRVNELVPSDLHPLPLIETVYCDASTQGIAGVLKQVHPDGNIYPVQYYSRALRSYERNYTISELECLAIVECVDKFRVYLLGTRFVIYSDHHALQWLKTIKDPTGRLFRWSLRLSAYDYEVKYLKGSRQYEADLLSRNPFCGFLSTGQIKDHQGELRRDTRYILNDKDLMTIIRRGVTKIIVPPSLRGTLLQRAHRDFVHPGISQMTRLIAAQYYWDGMTNDIRTHWYGREILPEGKEITTIYRRLVANGLHSCRPLRRLPLTPPNRRQRLEWCRARSTWMTEWHRVVFSDESRFCLSSDSRRVRVWLRREERSNPAAIVERPTVRQRGIMVWGAIAYDSRSLLLRIQGTMTAQRYVDDVLRPVTLPYLQGVPNALYQQDNARPYTARISQQALQDVQMLPWAPYSPDLSPIEHIWDIIGRRLHALPQPRSEDELWQMVEREWRAIPQDAIRTLIDSLPRRVAACIAVRGGPTCY
ncbi:K02A2.6-like [Cordylochernes scorpioides]|uniref:RNA-directed DNA polymerase n=1 Tax=Cordylochernes scorpioides TaxID=51811 RepID=A0ABY6K2F3_9ARAC|nr:K02A2.6-like [Cordylochernes scorpioides]